MSIRAHLLLPLLVCLTAQAKEINISESVEIGGIRQWITLKGDTEKPLLLFLHGGPGNPVIDYATRFTNDLQPHFLIVHWAQRESPPTLKLNPSLQPLTVSLFVSDAIELLTHLRTRFGKEKIHLVGHSWGGFLALMVAQRAPHLLATCIAISPMVHQLESEKRSLAWLKTRATETQNQQARHELQEVSIPFATKDLFIHRKWLAVFDHRTEPKYAAVETWAQTWLPLFNEASAINLTSTPVYHCPLYFFIGANDYQTHHAIAQQYFESVVAPAKELFLFSASSHNPHLTETPLFQQRVLSVTAPH